MKNLLKKVFFEFVYGGHLFSICNVLIVATMTLVVGEDLDLILLCIPYFLTQTVYSYNHFYELEYDIRSNPERAEHVVAVNVRLRMIIYIFLLSVLLASSNLKVVLLILAIFFSGILYTRYLKEFITRKFSGLKSIYISFFWSLLIFTGPLYHQISIPSFFIFLFLFVFLRGITNTTFSDIKDIESDRNRGMKTIAVKLGKESTIKVLHLINLLSVTPLIFGVYNSELTHAVLPLMLTSLYTMLYLIKSTNIKHGHLRLLNYTFVDGEYIFWPILVIIGMTFFS